MSTILIVEDEKSISDILAYNLEREGYDILLAYDGEEAISIIFDKTPDLILLDLMLPKMSGYDVCKAVRNDLITPIIMLTARGDTIDQVLGLELGADDYIKKPFIMKELLARVKANLRRVNMLNDVHSCKYSLKRFGNLIIDKDKYEVRHNNTIIELTLREYELVKFLSDTPGKVYTREELLSKVWGYEYFGDLRTVDVTISRLRDKLKTVESNEYIMTKRGIGYYFNNSHTC